MSYKRTSAGSILAALLAVSATHLVAQTAPAASQPTPPKEDETIVLSPFVVDASEDTGSYQASSTLAGTRVRTDLKDVASAITVVTQQFLQDTGSHNAQDLLVYEPNTEVGGLRGNYSGQGGGAQYNENVETPSNTTRVRGLDSADNTRNYFLTDIPFDSFNTGRVDLQRGPNSILFGVGSPAGIINASTNDATFKNTYKLENEIASYGSLRNTFDANRVLIKDVLSIRVAALSDNERYQEKPAYNDSTRYYVAGRFDPKIFGDQSHTSIRANFEYGKVSANNPRTLPPTDEITPWFTRLNKATLNEYTVGNDSSSANAGALFNATSTTGGWKEGRSYWGDVLSYYNGLTASGTAVTNSNTPTNVYSAQTNSGYAVNSAGVVASANGVGGLPQYAPVGIAPYSTYAANTASIPGGSYYADKVLTDPSIFDFYNNLLDGNNSHENQKWKAFNIAASQTFFDDRLGFEAVIDHQDYQNSQYNFLGGSANYAISVDVNATFLDGTPNPNLGRPYVANSSSYTSSSNDTLRNSYRFTATGDLRSEDFLGKGLLTEILGHHVFTALASRDERKNKSASWAQYATDPSWAQFNQQPTGTQTSWREFDWVDYLGGSLLGANSASGAHISSIQNVIKPSATTTATVFDSHWKATGVNPGDPYTYTSFSTGLPVTSTQSANPANYVGFVSMPVTWESASDPTQFPDLVTSSELQNYRDVSRGLTWQGYFFDGDLVPVYGWRRDSVVTYDTNAPTNGNGFTSLDYSQDPTTRRTVTGQSRSWGGVYHFPKAITKYLPWGTTVSAFYDHSENFKADAPRSDLSGNQLPNQDGRTKEYGITITTLDDKLSLKVNRFETTVANATLGSTGGGLSGLGGGSYYLWAAPTWGYFYAAELQDGLEGKVANPTGYYNYAYAGGAGDPAAQGGYGTAGFTNNATTVATQAIVNAWVNDFPLPDKFFNYYGIHPISITPSLAKSSGQLTSAFSAGYTDSPSDFNGIGSEQSRGGAPTSTVTTLSKGTEIELSAQPIKNWNLTVNYSHVTATKESIDPATTKFMADLYTFFSGPGGQLRLWGNNASPIGTAWIQNVYDPYLVETMAEGQSSPEVAPWRINGVTTYTFDRGSIKGLFVGGGARLEAAKILGYRYSATLGTLDVSQRLMGKEDEHFDFWIGYSRKVYKNVNWRIQLNLRDIGDKTHLVAARYEPDGSLALARIQEGTSWQLTNSFEF